MPRRPPKSSSSLTETTHEYRSFRKNLADDALDRRHRLPAWTCIRRHDRHSHLMTLALSNRYRRRLRLTSGRWQRRAIFLLGGIAVGAAAVALAFLADQAQLAFAFLLSKSRYAALVVTPLGFAASVFLTNRYFPNSQGSGIPQAIAARHLTDPAARNSLVSIRIAIGKIILTLLGLL